MFQWWSTSTISATGCMEHLVNNKNSLLLMRIVLTSVFKHISLFDFENAPIPPFRQKFPNRDRVKSAKGGGGLKGQIFHWIPPFFFLMKFSWWRVFIICVCLKTLVIILQLQWELLWNRKTTFRLKLWQIFSNKQSHCTISVLLSY